MSYWMKCYLTNTFGLICIISSNLTFMFFSVAHDLTFSQTHKGSPVPFGESGDCYSKVSCPQGRFSLSLLGTGFVVSPLTKWVTVGNYSSSRIRWLEVSTFHLLLYYSIINEIISDFKISISPFETDIYKNCHYLFPLRTLIA